MRSALFLGLLGAILAAGPGQALDPPTGYLHSPAALDTAGVLPPAPAVASPVGAADRAIFKATRALQGTPRWTLAINDVSEAIPSMLSDFSCAAGVTLSETTAPRLTAILRRLRPDVRAAVNEPKDLYRRQRPYLIDEGDICVAKDKELADSPDYPSGHATWGWTVGLVMAELAPDRATAILSRARAFGESRVVCGVHNASAIEAGRTNGAALVAALHGEATFRADMERARAEMAALRAAGRPEAPACAAEAALTGRQPW